LTWGRVKIDAADRLFSLYIRKRAGWKCEYCGLQFPEKSNQLQCSHYWGRRMESVRFDTDNADSFCVSCHQKLETEKGETKGTHNGEPVILFRAYKMWKINQLGAERFDALEVRAHTTGKKDRKMALLRIKVLMKDLK